MITVISVEKYKGSTYQVELSDGRKIYLNKQIANDFGIREGVSIPLSAIEQITYASDLRRARERALYLLEDRDHSYRELFEKLEKNYSEQICFEICGKMQELGFVNDERYAEKLAKYYTLSKMFSFRRARFEMQKKGISKELAEQTLMEYEDSSLERLRELVEKKHARYLTDEKGFLKVKNALARQGYDFSDISEVLSEYDY